MNKFKAIALVAGALLLIPILSSLIMLAVGLGIAWLVWNKDKIIRFIDDLKEVTTGVVEENDAEDTKKDDNYWDIPDWLKRQAD